RGRAARTALRGAAGAEPLAGRAGGLGRGARAAPREGHVPVRLRARAPRAHGGRGARGRRRPGRRLRRRLPRPGQPPGEPRRLGGGLPRAPGGGAGARRPAGELQRQRRGAQAPGRRRRAGAEGAGAARRQARVAGRGEAVLSASVRDVAIVGGGVAGLTLAYELVRRGASVVLVDAGASTGASAGEPAVRAAASLVPAALLNPHRGRTARARPGDMAGLEAFWRLARRLEEE